MLHHHKYFLQTLKKVFIFVGKKGFSLDWRNDRERAFQRVTTQTGGAMMFIRSLDHIVLTVKDMEETLRFYTRVLGMEEVTFGSGRKALRFGDQKINLHEAGKEFEPKADQPMPGSADLCFISDGMETEELISHLGRNGVKVEEGPVRRTGALGLIISVYIRDPDQNLIEISQYLEE